jgi:UrcA family protein
MKILVVAPLMIAALVTGTAHAQSMKVNFAGLDLDTPAGATELLTRIDAAAHTVCDAFDSSNSDSHRECLTKAVRAAVKQINKPQVTMVAENFKP